MRSIGIWSLLPVAVAALLFLGCKGSTTPPDMAIDGPTAQGDHDHAEHAHDEHEDHDHEHADDDHDHPTTYAEAVAKVETLETEIREALGKGEKEKADEALHEIGHVLEHVTELAKDATLSEADRENVKKHVDALFDHFGAIDEKIHSDAEVSYDAVAEKIHAAIEALHEHADK